MTTSRWPAVAAGLATVLLAATAGTAAGTDSRAGSAGQDRPDAATLLARDARGSTALPTTGLVGADGLLYDFSPLVVGGADGQLFLGLEFDRACADGRRFQKGLKRLTQLARTIEKSGRRVVLTVAPNKTSVYRGEIDGVNLPHGDCTRIGLDNQGSVLDNFSDPLFLPLRRQLAKDPREVYWRSDAHWSSVGASVYAEHLATRLDKKLGRRQKYAIGQEEHVGDLLQLLGIPTSETGASAVPATGVEVRVHPLDPDVPLQMSWTSTPRRKTLAGETVVVGDSFSYLGLGTLRSLFHKGQFVWIQPELLDYIAARMGDADTVVIEVSQRFVSTSILGTKSFRAAVRKQLRN